MHDFYAKELARAEAQLRSVQRFLTAWERDGSSEETKLARAFGESLHDQIDDLRTDLAQCGDRQFRRPYSGGHSAPAIAA